MDRSGSSAVAETGSMKTIQALIFDMDGVILDSNRLHVQAWALYNGIFGLQMDEAMQQRMFGKRNDELVRDFFGDHLSEEEVFAHGAAKEAVYRELMADQLEESLVPGLREFLERFGDLPTGVGTNAEPANVEFVLERAKLKPYFQAIVDGHQVAKAKPDPEVYLKVADLLHVDAANCVVFEDSYAGAQAGIAAGMRVVGLSTTYETIPGVEFMVKDFRDPSLMEWMRARL